MAAEHTLTRRSALAGLGAGSLGLFFGASAMAAPPAFDTGGSGSGGAGRAVKQLLRLLSIHGFPSE